MRKDLVIGVVIVLIVLAILWVISQFACKIPILKNLPACEAAVVVQKEPSFEPAIVLEPSPVPIPTTIVESEEKIEYGDLEESRAQEPELEEFVQELKRSIETADFVSLETMISDPFYIAKYTTSYNSYNPEGAIGYLQTLISPGQISVDLSSEGRRKAIELSTTSQEASFVILTNGWPGQSLLGVTKIGDKYYWTELIKDIDAYN